MPHLVEVEQGLAQKGPGRGAPARHSPAARVTSSISRPLQPGDADPVLPGDDVGTTAPEYGLSSNVSTRSPSYSAISDASSPTAFAHREHQPEQLLLDARCDPRHHPQIEQPAAVRRHEHVAGMRIGVEEAVDQDLAQVGAKELAASANPSSSSRAMGLRMAMFLPST